MPRSFLVKKYLKQKYDADQIKLQALKEANASKTEGTDNTNDSISNNNNNNNNNSNSNNNNYTATTSHNVIASLLNNARALEGDVIKPHATAPYTPLVNPACSVQPLSVKHINGYINDVTYRQTDVKMEEAKVPIMEEELLTHENRHNLPRRSVIVTNTNHPANRHCNSYDVSRPVNSPPIAHTAGEQNMPYDYSLPRPDRPPTAHAPISASPAHQSALSPSLAHNSSPAALAYAPIPSLSTDHHGFKTESAHSSPGRMPPNQAEFLPADHPFNHPLIQQLINQRLHVPSEKPSDQHHSHHHHPQHLHNPHHHHQQDDAGNFEDSGDHSFPFSSSHIPTTAAAPHCRDFEAYEANQPRVEEGQGRAGGHHYTTSGMTVSASSIMTSAHLAPIHTHPNHHMHTAFPPSPSPTIPSSSPTLPYSESKTHFILPPPSPPTPNAPYASPSHTRLTSSPHPASPVSPASSTTSSISSCNSSSVFINSNTHGNALGASIHRHYHHSTSSTHDHEEEEEEEDDDKDQDSDSEDKAKQNAYTYDAFLISDGRSRKRTHEQIETREAGRLRYTCNECGKDYATSSNLSRHKQTHRALDSKNAKKCPHCDKVYVSMPALSMHILTHDLKHACNICGKTFSRPWLLQGHMRSHTGEKPFGCAHCGKAFADRSNLRAHMQTHSAFKHFACTKCNKSFALKSYLNKHLESSCVKEEILTPSLI